MPVLAPLRGSGTLLPGETFAGDVGNTVANAPAVLVLDSNSTATVSVGGFDAPASALMPHYAIINETASSTLFLTQVGGGHRSPFSGPGLLQLNLAAGSLLSGGFTMFSDGAMTVNGPGALLNYNGALNGGNVTINADLVGNADIRMLIAPNTPEGPAILHLNDAVAAGETIDISSGTLSLEKPMSFLGKVNWTPTKTTPNQPNFDPARVVLAGVTADSYTYDSSGTLHLWNGANDVDDIRVSMAAGTPIYSSPNGIELLSDPGVDVLGKALPVHAPPPPPSSNFVVTDTNTNVTTNVAGDPYTGPVKGINEQYINFASDGLNVTPQIDGTFVHTGSGNDAIDFSGRNGTNVADGGTGSNFITSSNGSDTIFDNANGATSSIWNTIVNFHPGDAATLWGVTEKDFTFNWVPSDGAQGFQGLSVWPASF